MFALDYTGGPVESILSSAFRSEEEIGDAIRVLVDKADRGLPVASSEIQDILDTYGYSFFELPTYLQELIDSIDLEDE